MPQTDPEISKLVEQAARIKEKERRAAEKEERRRTPKPVPFLDIESVRAYHALYPHPPTVIWLFAFIGSVAGLIVALVEDLFASDIFIFGSIAGVVTLYGIVKAYIVPFVWYFFMRGWRNRLPFTLNGWSEFGSSRNLLDSTKWRDLTIRIDSPTTDPAFRTALDAVITILLKNVANVTYEGDVGQPSRHAWTWDAKKRVLTGSANCQVLGLLMDFFRGPFHT